MNKELNLKKSIFIVFVLFCIFFIAIGFQANAVTDDYWLAAYVLKKSKLFFTSFDWANRQYLEWSGQYILNFLQGLFTFHPLKTNLTSGLHGILFLGTTLFWILDSYKKWEVERESRLIFSITLFLGLATFSYHVLGESIFLAASTLVWSYLFFVLCYLSVRSNLFSKYTWMKYLCFFALGNSSEFLILPTIAFFIMTRKEELPSRKILIASYTAGLFIYLLAPGTFGHIRGGLSEVSLSPLDQLYHLQIVFTRAFLILGMNMLYAVPLMFCCQVSSLMNLSDIREKMIENFLFAILSLFILVPVIGPAAGSSYFFFTIFFALTFFWFIQYCKRRFLEYRIPVNVQQVTLLVYLLVGLWLSSVNFLNAMKIRASFIQQHTTIEIFATKTKKMTIPVLLKPIENHLLYYSDITKDENDVNNQARVEYYELESIVGE